MIDTAALARAIDDAQGDRVIVSRAQLEEMLREIQLGNEARRNRRACRGEQNGLRPGELQ
jgi:hypothetical protein